MHQKPRSKTLAFLCGLLAVTQFAAAQDLTQQQKQRILKRYPQADRNGDGELSAEEIAPIRERLEQAQQRRKQKPKQTQNQPKGPVPTHANLQYGDHKNAVMYVWLVD